MFEALGIDLISLLWQIVAFAVLIWLLNRLLFRPIRKTLDERAQRIRASIDEAERITEQAIRADEEHQAHFEEVRQRAQEIVAQAREQGRQEREGILEQAREEAQLFLQDARVQLDLERRDMTQELRQQVAGLTVLAAGRLIGKTLDPEKHRHLVEQYIADLDRPLAELDRALASVAVAEAGAVQVRSAAPLGEQTEQAISARVARALGREAEVSFGTDPDLIGGFTLQVGDHVVDLSVARKLSDLFRELSA